MTIDLSTSCRCSHSTKNKLTSPEDGLQRPQRLDVIHAEPPFSPPHRSRRRVLVKRGVGAGFGVGVGAGTEVCLFFKECCFRVKLFLKNAVLGLGLGLTTTLTLKQHSLKKR